MLNVEFLVLKITYVVSEKRKLDNCDYLGRFLFLFYPLINVYPADFLA